MRKTILFTKVDEIHKPERTTMSLGAIIKVVLFVRPIEGGSHSNGWIDC
jgi:hypothetical protein